MNRPKTTTARRRTDPTKSLARRVANLEWVIAQMDGDRRTFIRHQQTLARHMRRILADNRELRIDNRMLELERVHAPGG